MDMVPLFALYSVLQVLDCGGKVQALAVLGKVNVTLANLVIQNCVVPPTAGEHKCQQLLTHTHTRTHSTSTQ